MMRCDKGGDCASGATLNLCQQESSHVVPGFTMDFLRGASGFIPDGEGGLWVGYGPARIWKGTLPDAGFALYSPTFFGEPQWITFPEYRQINLGTVDSLTSAS